MSAKLLMARALVSGTLLLYGGAAYAASFMSTTPNLGRDVQLVRSGGGGGRVGGGGGGVAHGGGGGGAAHVGGGGSYGGRISSGGHLSPGHFSSGRVTSGRSIARANVTTRGRVHNDGAYVARHSIDRRTIAKRDDDRSGRRHAEHDWDHDWNHNDWRHHHHRFSSVYVYTPWLYSNSDCGWLYQRAIATGSAYWWSRYDACVNY